jgi:hypothetical protein
MIYTWRNVKPSPKPNTLNKLFANDVFVSIQLSRNFFTSQRLLLASKKKGWREGKKGKSYNNDEVEEININEKEKNFDLNKVEAKIGVVIEKLKKEYSSMRIGRANPGLKVFLLTIY